MLRIFMTGDNHIGLKYTSHEKSAELAAARLNAFPGMVDRANGENCGLFVITGDLFENTYSIPKRDVSAVADMLSAFKGTVAVLPGNHDYYDRDVKVWQYFKDAISKKDNILLLSEYRPYTLDINGETVVLYPALCTSLHSAPGENNLGWIKAEPMPQDGTYRLGVAHGAVEGETIDSEGAYFLMSRGELESIPVDAWLIGHTHVPFPRDLAEDRFTGAGRIFNAGTHVQTDVSCNTEGCCFIIEIGPDKTVSAKKFRSGTVFFSRKHIAAGASGLAGALSSELSALPDNSSVDLILSGAVSAGEYTSRRDIIENALSRFIEGTYDDTRLSKLITRGLIDAEFPETSFSAQLLYSLLDEPKEAQLVYELLCGLKEGGK